MLSIEIRRLMGMMTATWFVVAACGGDSTGGGAGTGGGNGVGGNGVGVGGSTGLGGAGGATGLGGAGTGGTPVNDAGRLACGTANNGTGCNPNGNNRVCDLMNNRCVQCQTNADCAANPMQMGNPICDTTLAGMAMLPRYQCETCVVAADCGANMACVGNNCVVTCTTDANCAATPNTPACNTATMRCVECQIDTQCAAMVNTPFCNAAASNCVQCTTNAQCAGRMSAAGVAQPFCRLMGGGAFTCRTCLTAADCPIPGSTCSGGGNCNAPPPDSGAAADTGAPRPDTGAPVVDAASGG